MSIRAGQDNTNLPWVEKYRPSSLDYVYGQHDTVDTVRKFVQDGRLPHLLFYGPPGTGKTSTIMALAKEIYGKNYRNMVLELNASDDRGISVVRDQIVNFASTRQIFSNGFKLIILDEADAMTNVAQNALRRVIEKFTKNTRFCVLANYAHKLNPALLSRCTRFRFQPISQEAIQLRINDVIKQEGINIDDDALQSLLKLSKGDMRKALNVLQACFTGLDSPSQAITSPMIYECVGAPDPQDIEHVLDTIIQENWEAAFTIMNRLKLEKGYALIDLVNGFVDILGGYQLEKMCRLTILKGLADIEYAISRGGNDAIQNTAVIGVIKKGFETQT
ncbi:Replication factor C (RF-C) subunit [Komagataella phaffii CBS 7435]|uniref:Subunit of heteropentameric Replication factor C (RF-C), which is a DNA binding protein and ATPase t n=2 Tax=Komagataella phaffii TaxID=460519 RepID=C4QZJ6_KOMPG|nr:Subunit of heteropentameric Replication factor C (RF-C), which is a DNA binding protein and ATPase t [Komagataella phaffii GS115]AOA62674.1 GQ67_00092T0 [Komagataella phaffii]CAH2448835.1 Replication factor C (RF-C) subunit [Komagataella phaffii CBS 7435]AOA67142.1 GQ68_01295T0 [Komagataella phaffii GS115]CAY68670.1 Subunit of heteropentameric Replication factor C (RF-C), which is a DNA binding protein and ATPase t [Komagataella phaffii GS115]CCA38916.1 Replication factor C (RF-C) subunit [